MWYLIVDESVKIGVHVGVGGQCFWLHNLNIIRCLLIIELFFMHISNHFV